MANPAILVKPGTDFQSFYNSLDFKAQQGLDACSEKVWAPIGTIICRQGDESDCVYILEEGVVEVLVETCEGRESPAIAYLSRGDIIGELGVLNEKPRSATLRVAADVYYRKICHDVFLRLLHDVPGFGLYISHRLAERLANTTANLTYNSYCVDLSGKLPNFDLLAVFQTIRDSGTTGELRLIGPNKERIGDFFIERGRIRSARYLHLFGLEALWQVFLGEIHGAFSFQRQPESSSASMEAAAIDIEIGDALLTAAVKRDEFVRLPGHLKKLEGRIIRRSGRSLDWDEVETAQAAREVWEITERESQSLQTIWRRSSHSVVTLGQVVQRLLATDQADYATETHSAPAPAPAAR